MTFSRSAMSTARRYAGVRWFFAAAFVFGYSIGFVQHWIGSWRKR